MQYELAGQRPTILGEDHFIADSAILIGDVVLNHAASIWFNAVVRADNDRIEIGPASNIQDHAMLHVDEGTPMTIGRNVTIGHHATLHGCTVGDYSLVGINAVVLNRARIGRYCLISANALVTEGMEIPDGSLVMGSPARIMMQLDENARLQLEKVSELYVVNAKKFKRGLKLLP
jgi:carbonic anhydrase/acetyltransferase-like protein (isoleucine patch superfamily)